MCQRSVDPLSLVRQELGQEISGIGVYWYINIHVEFRKLMRIDIHHCLSRRTREVPMAESDLGHVKPSAKHQDPVRVLLR